MRKAPDGVFSGLEHRDGPCLDYFPWEAGYAQAPAALFLDAERALDDAVLPATETGIWRLVEHEADILKRIVAVHDDPLARVTGRACVEARRRLEVLLSASRTASPIRKRWVECAGASDERALRASSISG